MFVTRVPGPEDSAFSNLKAEMRRKISLMQQGYIDDSTLLDRIKP